MECQVELNTKARYPSGVKSITGGKTTPTKKARHQVSIRTLTLVPSH